MTERVHAALAQFHVESLAREQIGSERRPAPKGVLPALSAGSRYYPLDEPNTGLDARAQHDSRRRLPA